MTSNGARISGETGPTFNTWRTLRARSAWWRFALFHNGTSLIGRNTRSTRFSSGTGSTGFARNTGRSSGSRGTRNTTSRTFLLKRGARSLIAVIGTTTRWSVAASSSRAIRTATAIRRSRPGTIIAVTPTSTAARRTIGMIASCLIASIPFGSPSTVKFSKFFSEFQFFDCLKI